jgi:hypothetical protein
VTDLSNEMGENRPRCPSPSGNTAEAALGEYAHKRHFGHTPASRSTSTASEYTSSSSDRTTFTFGSSQLKL